MAVLCNTTDIHLTSSMANLPQAGTPVTITTWMAANWTTTAGSFVGLYGPSPNPSTAIQIGCRNTAGSCQVWTWGGGLLVATAGNIMTNGKVHFIAYTFDGNTNRLYVDGVLQATSTTANLAGKFAMFYINGFPTGGTAETSNHMVDTVRLYNRALSQNEITTIFNSTGARHGIVNGLMSYYEFDEAAQGANVSSVIDQYQGANLMLAGSGTAMTYTYSNAESKLRPVL
jgi:hypothetical protein